MELDPRTLATHTATISVVLALLAVGYGRMRRTYAGFGWWTASLVLVSAALASIAMREVLPALVIHYGGSVFGAAAMLAVIRGQLGFCADAPPLAPAIVVAAAGLAAMVGADLAGALPLRALLGATTTGLLALYAGWAFLRERVRGLRPAARYCAAVLIGFGLVRLWRAGYLGTSVPDYDILAASSASMFNYTINALFPVLWGFGFVLLNAARLEDELEASRAELARLAATDPLTGLRNRRAFFAEAAQELRRARRYRLPVTVLLLDLDRFKQVNDRFGHLAGDELLRQVAAVMTRELRVTDLHARFGGEEFVALLVQTPATDAAPTAERLRRAIAALSVESLGNRFGTTASIGLAATGDGEVELEDLLRYADAALYRAKQGGRDRVVSA